jgi:hypothetical protein
VEPLEGGQSLHQIGRAFAKSYVSIHFLLSYHGGIVPPARLGSLLTLTLAEREHLSRDCFWIFDSPDISVLILFALLAASAPIARADYAVLRSGARIHVTGDETAGDRMQLCVPGGTIELPIDDLVSVEPEDTFPANTPRHQS